MNIKKIGLTALAGSLAMFSANAGELTVSGNSSASHMTKSNSGTAATQVHTGNPMGMDTRITFAGSGELDNGFTTSFYVVEQMNGASGMYSGEVALGLGDLGTISLNQGAGNVGADAIDDETPRAYEEADDRLTTNFRGLANPQGSGNLIKYTNTLGMVNINLGVRSGGGTNNAVGVTGGNSENAYTGALTSSPIDGLTVGAGYSQVEKDTGKDDEGYATFIKYAFGPVTVGAQRNITTSATAASAAEGNQMSIAFNVNDNLALSYSDGSIDHFGTGATSANVSEDFSSINVSYTMGGMTIAAQSAKADNAGGTLNADEEVTEIVLSLAF